MSSNERPGIYFGLGKSRLAFHPTITKGDWYFGVNCHGCGRPIHTLHNQNKSPVPPRVFGPGKLSIPCYHCGRDDLYELTELISQVAVESRMSIKDRRVSPSSSSKKPYLPHFEKYHVNIGPQAIEIVPEISIIVARIVSCWTLVETAVASFLSICLKANTEPSVALYLSLKNSRARKEALESVVSLTLSPQDQELYYAVIRWKDAVEKARNDIAHGVLGASLGTDQHLFWMSTGDYAIHSVYVRKDGLTDELEMDFKRKLFVFEIGALERIAREIEDLYDFLRSFGGYLTSDREEWRVSRYPELCSVPRVAKELSVIRRTRKVTQESD